MRYRIEHIRDAAYNKSDDMLKASTLELISTLKELLHMHPLYNEQMRNFIQFGADFHDPSRLADLAASLTSGEGAELQRVLEEVRVPERVEASLVLLRKEANLLKLQQDIGTFCLEVFIFGYWCSLSDVSAHDELCCHDPYDPVILLITIFRQKGGGENQQGSEALLSHGAAEKYQKGARHREG